jgi:hypothetical protein
MRLYLAAADPCAMHHSLRFPGAFSLLLLAACAKEEAPVPNPPPAPTQLDLGITGAAGVRMLWGGEEVTILESANEGVLPQSGTDGDVVEPPALSTKRFWASLYDGGQNTERFRMTIGSLTYEGPQVIPSLLDSVFAPGPRSYGVASTGSLVVQLEHTDAAGVTWSSVCDPQSGGGFTIVETASGYDGIGSFGYYVDVKATFNATFRNCLTNATRSATGGVLVLRFRDV